MKYNFINKRRNTFKVRKGYTGYNIYIKMNYYNNRYI